MPAETISVRTRGNSVSLSDRRQLPEIMDQPNLDPEQHRLALRGLRRVNCFSFSSRIYWPTIQRLATQFDGRTLRVLDLACGGGDVTHSLAKLARRKGVDLDITGFDINPLAVSMAADHTKALGLNNVRFAESDVLNDPLPTDFDIVMCSLFLHHLSEIEAVALMEKMAAATRAAVLVNDLQRSRVGYYLALVGCRFLTRSAIVHHDGPVSVAGAYTIREAKLLAEMAGLKDAAVVSCWPERFLLSWLRS